MDSRAETIGGGNRMTIKISNARRWMTAGAALTMLVPVLAACSSDNKNDPDNRRTLRIGTMYGSSQDESYFRQQFTDMFEFSHPNIDIEIVPAIDYTETQFDEPDPNAKPVDPIEKVKAIMTGPNPIDVMIMDSGVLGSLVRDNLLMPLDAKMKESKIDPNDYVPAVIDGIKSQGDGQLYALAPTYSPSALFYNKKMFSKLNVSPPTADMTWDQVFNLARQLKSGEGKDATFGFTFNQWGYSDPYGELTTYTAPLQLRMYDANAEKMTVNTPQWENAWTTITQLYKDHVMPTTEDLQVDQGQMDNNTRYNPYQQQAFFRGKVAMVIGSYGMINDIATYNKNYQKFEGMEQLDWDVVQVPSFAEFPGISGYTSLSSLSAINAKAPNPDDAWEFVKFMNGKEWGKLKSRSSYEMPALKEFIKVKDGMSYNIDAFTTTKPIPNQNSYEEQQLYNERPNLYMIQDLARTEFNKVIQNEKTVKEALAEFETKGNDLLQKIKLNPKGQIDGVNDGAYGGGGIDVKPMLD